MFDIKKVGQGYKSRNSAIRWQSQNLQTSPTHFCSSSYGFRYNIFKLLTLIKNVKVTEYNSCNYAIANANLKIYKCLQHVFALAFTVSEIYSFLIVTVKKQVKVTEYNFCNDMLRWRISIYTNVICDFRKDVTCKESNRQTHIETDKAIAIGENADLLKNPPNYKLTLT